METPSPSLGVRRARDLRQGRASRAPHSPPDIDAFFLGVHSATTFLFRFFRSLFRRPFEVREILRQCYEVGSGRFPLITLTGFVTGIVFTKQSRPSLATFGASSWLPSLITIALVRALAPLVTALICAGKVGSNIGAELGSMRVTEQIDAMEVSAVDPMKFLVVTRVIATTTMVPVLMLYCAVIGLLGSYVDVHAHELTSLRSFLRSGFQEISFLDARLVGREVDHLRIHDRDHGHLQGLHGDERNRGRRARGERGRRLLDVRDLHRRGDHRADHRLDPGLVMETVITIRRLFKSFGERKVLRGIDLELAKTENLVVLGRSGSGKSVLIKVIAGLLKPDSGTVEVLGHKVDELDDRDLQALRRRLGFLFQHSALYDSMSVRENLEFPLVRNEVDLGTAEIDARVVEALEAVGLRQAIDQMPAELSGGQRKRVGIARTLILRPEIMLYDEPTAGLDPITSTEINKLINQVRERFATSSIIITHDLACARMTGDRIAMLLDGEFQREGTFDEVFATEDKRVRDFYDYNFTG